MKNTFSKKTIAYKKETLRCLLAKAFPHFSSVYIPSLVDNLDDLEEYILQHSATFVAMIKLLYSKNPDFIVHGFGYSKAPLPVSFINALLEGQIRMSDDGYSYFAPLGELKGTFCVPFFIVLNPRFKTHGIRVKGNINFDDIEYFVFPDGLKDFIVECLEEAVLLNLEVNRKPFTKEELERRIAKLKGYNEL